MATQLEVFNRALDLLGSEPLDTLTDEQPRQYTLNRHWDAALHELLRAYPWNWAKKREELSAESPAPDYGWAYRYPLPDDYLLIVGFNEEDVYTESDLFEIEGGFIMTDEDEAQIEYIAKPTDGSGSGIDADWTTEALLARMDPLAVNALVTLLAAKAAPKIVQDGLGIGDALLSRYYNSDIIRARYRNIVEANRPAMFPPTASTWTNARRVSTNG